jgi:hypothetical protein
MDADRWMRLAAAGRDRHTGWANRIVEQVESLARIAAGPTPAELGDDELVGSHRDLNAHNVLFSEGSLHLVDWDSGGPAWPRWERVDFALRWAERPGRPFCVTGIREGEAVGLSMASLEGHPRSSPPAGSGQGGQDPGHPHARAVWRRSVGDSEDKAFWTAFLRSLRARRLLVPRAGHLSGPRRREAHGESPGNLPTRSRATSTRPSPPRWHDGLSRAHHRCR